MDRGWRRVREHVRQIWPDGGGTTLDGWGAWRRLRAGLRAWSQRGAVQERLGRLALQGALAAALLAAGALVRWLPVPALDPVRQGVGDALTRDLTASMAWARASGWASRRGGWGAVLAGAYAAGRRQVAAWAEPWRPSAGSGGAAPAAPAAPAPATPAAPAAPAPATPATPAPAVPAAPPPAAPAPAPVVTSPGVLSVPRPGDRTMVRSSPGAPVRPVGGRVVAGFGWRGEELHYGVDLAAPPGTPVRAMWAGRVSGKGTDPRLGPYVELEHSGGFTTRYAPLAGVTLQAGEPVQAGQVIGQVGAAAAGERGSGHLHLEVRKDGLAVQPEPFLSDGNGGI